MSSKFAPSVKKSTYPPWCKAGVPQIVPPFVAGWPQVLVVYAHWVDLDPLKPTDVSEAFTIPVTNPGLVWYGESSDDGTRLGTRATREPDKNVWDIDLFIWDEWRVAEDFDWQNVPPVQDDPLKISPPPDLAIPGVDFRTIYISG